MYINSNLQLAVITFPDFPIGGVIGTAADTVDICSSFSIQQTSAGQNITLPVPTDVGVTTVCTIENVGTVSFYIQGILLDPGKHTTIHNTSATWDTPVSTGTPDSNKIDVIEKAAVNGVASLDGSGKVPSGQLPSYVDDVLEFINLASFPVTGNAGVIYLDTTSNLTYRWSGAAYILVSSAPDNIYLNNGTLTGARTLFQGGNDLNFERGGITNSFLIHPTGNASVGIGTAISTATLTIQGNNANAAGNNLLDITDTTSNHTLSVDNASGGTDMRILSNSKLELQTTTNTNQLVLSINGNVGMGVAFPTHKLDVNGSGLFRNGTIATDYTLGNQIYFGYANTDTYRHVIKTQHDSTGNINSINLYTWDSTNDTSTDDGTKIGLSVRHGKIGVGVAIPTAPLTVVAEGATDQFVGRFTQTGNTTAGVSTLIGLGTESTTFSKAALGFQRTGSFDRGDLTFNVSSNNTTLTDTSEADERMRITSGGNVGIANNVPTEKLDVTGNIRLSGAIMPNNSAGTAGQILTSGGPGAPATWGAAPSGGATNTDGLPEGVTNLYHTPARVLNTQLTGFVLTDATDVTAADQVVKAIGKLQRQIDDIPVATAAANDAGTETGVSTTSYVTPASGTATYIKRSAVNAKGDLVTATANDTPAILAVGTDNQVLIADSTAPNGIKWVTPAGTPTVQTFTITGTYTPTTGMKYAIVEMVGGGGGGGGCATGSVTVGVAGKTGGGGGYVKALVTAAQVGVSKVVTIGAAGAAGAAGGAGNGGSGGITTLGALLTASGGAAGLGTPAPVGFNSSCSPGATGGGFTVTTGIDLGSEVGGNGGVSFAYVSTGFLSNPGRGGDSKWGKGSSSPAVAHPTGFANSLAGVAGVGAGAGGSGGISAGTTSTVQAGGAGVAGKVIITEFF